MAKDIDPVVAAWRKSLHCLIHPYLPLLDTLLEMEGRLDAVDGFLATLDPADKEQAARGVAVGTLAVQYGDQLIDHFGLLDGDELPPPANLAQARQVVGNMLNFVRERIHARRMADAPDNVLDADTTDETVAEVDQPAASNGTTTTPTAEKPVLVVDRDTFTVRWRNRECRLGHTKEFLLIEYLHGKVGRFVAVTDLTDVVWEGGDPEQNTVQKTVSKLRKKLGEAGMVDLADAIVPERGHYALMLS